MFYTRRSFPLCCPSGQVGSGIREGLCLDEGVLGRFTVGMRLCHEDEVRRKWIHPLGVIMRGSSCLPLGPTAHRCEGGGQESHYHDLILRARTLHCSSMPSTHLNPLQQNVLPRGCFVKLRATCGGTTCQTLSSAPAPP